VASPLYGLYPAADFRLTDGRCVDCPTIPQALWYFAHEVIAVPKDRVPVASFATGVPVDEDLHTWLAARSPDAPAEYPSLVWVAAPHVVAGARLSADSTRLVATKGIERLTLVPKIPLNRSYFDASSAAFFAQRQVKIRGTVDAGAIVARTLWPEDFRLERKPSPRNLAANMPTTAALRALVRGDPNGGARSPYAVTTLWQRDAAQDAAPSGRAVFGIILNGAQGDDDEAHAGHFALVTGRIEADGAIGDWLTNNFYSPDTESEKGIIAAPVPLDNYLAELNSGQNWYRPSHMIVAVLGRDRGPALVQAAFNRVYNQFWRHQLHYRHATMNCTGISVDVLRWLGWDVPVRGPASRLVAWLAYPYQVIKERSIEKAAVAFDYLVEDQTRLLPAAAFEEIGASLFALAGAAAAPPSSGILASMIAEDLDAILFIRFPQFPSSRAFGDAPIVTPWEFHSRLPAVPQIVPVPPRPFPEALRDPDLLPARRPASAYAAALWGTLSLVGIPIFLYGRWKRWREKARSASR
jgi:hypothetical protein